MSLLSAILATEPLQKERLKKCSSCIHNAGGRCKACGCILKYKVRLTASRCPKGLW